MSDIEEELLANYPIVDYRFFKSDTLSFNDNVREVCKQECQMYAKSYSCPPAVGSPAECRERCLSYKDAFIFSTVALVNDIANLEETLATKPEHEKITREIKKTFEARYGECLALSADACSLCEKCAYPNEPCCHPEIMLPCIESQTIVVTNVAETLNMDFFNGANVVTWFSLILYNMEK